MVVGVKGTGSIEERAGEMDRWLKDKLPRGTGVNFVAHSMVSQPVPAMEWSSRRSKRLTRAVVCGMSFHVGCLHYVGRIGLSLPDHASETHNVYPLVVDHDRDA